MDKQPQPSEQPTTAPDPGNGGTGAQTVTVPVMQSDSNGTAPAATNGISADEIALYDRQIRLWGMRAQEKIRNANILLITIKALGNEVAKNLVLAGIGSLTILDPDPVTETDLGAQFLLSGEEALVGRNRAEAAYAALQRLNPRVRVRVDTGHPRLKPPCYYAEFDVVIATDLDSCALNLINTATRLNNRPFYAAGCHGVYGFIFADLIEHDFVIERARSNVPTPLGPESRTRTVLSVTPKPGDEANTELVTKREVYSTWLLASGASSLPPEIQRSSRRRRAVTPILSCLRALWEFGSPIPTNPAELMDRPPHPAAHPSSLAQFTRLCGAQHASLGLPAETLRAETLRSFLQNVGAEIAPVAALLGGRLAQDVINVLGATQQPLQNFVVFDAGDAALDAPVFALHPDGPLGKDLLPLSGPGAQIDPRAAEVAARVTAEVTAAAAAAGIPVSGGSVAATNSDGGSGGNVCGAGVQTGMGV